MRSKLVILMLVMGFVALTLTAAYDKSHAKGKPIKLNLVASFPKKSVASRAGAYFVETVNRQGKGKIKINWKGASEIIPTFDQPEAVIKGVIDMGAMVTNYFAGVVPGCQVMEVSRFNTADQGPGTKVYDYLVKMYAEKGIRYIGEYAGGLDTGNFYVYTRIKPESPGDLAGKKFRVAPLTRQFIEALGAEPITMPGSEIYLALERGVVDGFIWPIYASFNEMGFPKVVKYVIHLPVYRGVVGMFMNLKAWNKLPKDVQDLLLKVQMNTQYWWEGFLSAEDARQQKEAKAAGMQFVKFSRAENEKYIKLSQDALWAYFKKILSPKRYKELRQLLEYE